MDSDCDIVYSPFCCVNEFDNGLHECICQIEPDYTYERVLSRTLNPCGYLRSVVSTPRPFGIKNSFRILTPEIKSPKVLAVVKQKTDTTKKTKPLKSHVRSQPTRVHRTKQTNKLAQKNLFSLPLKQRQIDMRKFQIQPEMDDIDESDYDWAATLQNARAVDKFNRRVVKKRMPDANVKTNEKASHPVRMISKFSQLSSYGEYAQVERGGTSVEEKRVKSSTICSSLLDLGRQDGSGFDLEQCDKDELSSSRMNPSIHSPDFRLNNKDEISVEENESMSFDGSLKSYPTLRDVKDFLDSDGASIDEPISRLDNDFLVIRKVERNSSTQRFAVFPDADNVGSDYESEGHMSTSGQSEWYDPSDSKTPNGSDSNGDNFTDNEESFASTETTRGNKKDLQNKYFKTDNEEFEPTDEEKYENFPIEYEIDDCSRIVSDKAVKKNSSDEIGIYRGTKKHPLNSQSTHIDELVSQISNAELDIENEGMNVDISNLAKIESLRRNKRSGDISENDAEIALFHQDKIEHPLIESKRNDDEKSKIRQHSGDNNEHEHANVSSSWENSNEDLLVSKKDDEDKSHPISIIL